MNHYDAMIRDADMLNRKMDMLGAISDAFVEVGGTGALLPEIEKFIESCARNGVQLTVRTREGPFAIERGSDGRQVYH